MPVPQTLTRQLLIALDDEIKLYRRYLELMSAERTAVTVLRPADIDSICQEREQLHERMNTARDKRLELVKTLPGAESSTLTDLVRRHWLPEDQRRLAPKVRTLRELVQSCREQGKQFQRVVNFSLNLVNGSVSILCSGASDVNRSYTKKGVAKASYTSARPTFQGVQRQV